jgi:hypothetical protein
MVEGIQPVADRYWAFTKIQLGIASQMGGTLKIELASRCWVLIGFECWIALQAEFCFDHSMNYGKDDGG